MVSKSGRVNYWKRFEGQTRMKHCVLSALLDRWPRVLIQAGWSQLWFVDGFAGRGRDDEGKPGSPIIARDLAKNIEEAFADTGYVPPAIGLIAIEADSDNFKALERNVADNTAGSGGVLLFEGPLSQHVDEVMSTVGTDPALFFLDPWGVKGLSAEIVERLLSSDLREVLLLFDDDGAERIHSSATAPIKSEPEAHSALSLFDAGTEGAATEREGPSSDAIARSAEATADVLRVVFGPHYSRLESALQGLQGTARRKALLREYMELLKDAGATHVLAFSVRDELDKHHYYLIHASRHKKAFTVMKDALNRAENRRKEESGVNVRLFFQSEADIGAAADAVARHFAGRQGVRWQDEKKPGTVRAYAAEETQLLFSDMAALKAELARRGYQVKGTRAATYSFPSS